MDQHPAQAENTTGLPCTDRKIAAAISAQESHWFLDAVTPSTERQLGFTVLNLARRGWQHTAAELQELNPEVLLTCWSTPSLDETWLESDQCRLRYVCHLTGSVRHIVPRRFIERGGLVTNWGGVPSAAVAEHALLLALAALRNLPRWPEVFTEPMANSERMERLRIRTLIGRRVGIHGFGQVAAALVRLLAPFNVSITAFSPGVPPAVFARAGVAQARDLREVFAGSDVVFECEALTARTRHTVTTSELAALPDGGVFVNVARAGLVDEDALLCEARKKRIRVALDVFVTEPLAPNSPWLQVPGVVLSPHIAGPTYDQYSLCTEIALTNIEHYLMKREMTFLVTPEIYDRST
jgi:phosphoglycerate dehydrogenase-like enzyme